MLSFHRLLFVIYLCLVTREVLGADIDPLVPDGSVVVENVVVVGSRTERGIDDLAAAIDVKTAEEIERGLTHTLADMFRFQPGQHRRPCF